MTPGWGRGEGEVEGGAFVALWDGLRACVHAMV
jgi:hypothetical protein